MLSGLCLPSAISVTSCKMTLRKTTRRLTHHSTRMLNGARRQPPTDWVGVACRAGEEFLRIMKRLEPFIEEQKRLRDNQQWMESWEPCLRKAYGPRKPGEPVAPVFRNTPMDPAILQKELRAQEKTKAVIARLKAKLERKR